MSAVLPAAPAGPAERGAQSPFRRIASDFLANPGYGRTEKRGLVAALAETAKAPEVAGRLLRALLDRGRIARCGGSVR